MSVVRELWIIAVLLTAGIASAADQTPPDITITFAAEQVKAAGITPGGDAIVFGCLIGQYSKLPSLEREAKVVRDEDGNGEVTLNVANLPTTSVWVVVDFLSGRYQVAAPEATVAGSASPREMRLGEDGWKTGIAAFALRRDYLEWLVVRPGAGAWTMSSVEGGSADGDGVRNGRLALNLERMEKLAGENDKPKPPSVKSKDVLVVIDPHTLEFFVRGAI